MRNDARVSPVALLFFARGPAAIVLMVRAVIINAVNAVSGGTFNHVGDKSRQSGGTAPLVADSNAASAVTIPLRVGRVVTSVNHVIPTMIKRMIGKAMPPRAISRQTTA